MLGYSDTGCLGICPQDEWSPCPDCHPEAARAAKARAEAAAASAASPPAPLPPTGADAEKQLGEGEGAARGRRARGSLERPAGNGYDLDDLDWDALEELAAQQLKVPSCPLLLPDVESAAA